MADEFGFEAHPEPKEPKDNHGFEEHPNQDMGFEAQAKQLPKYDIGLPEALLASLGNAVSAQTLPKMAAALTAATDDGKYTDQYHKRLEEARDYMKQVEEQHPIGNIAGEIGGTLLSPINEIGQVAKGSGLLSRLVGMAKNGATFGGLGAYGASNKEGLDAAGDVAKGMAIGGVTAPVIGETLGATGKAIGAAKDYAAENPLVQKVGAAFKLGQEHPDFYKIDKRKAIANNLQETLKDEVIPLLDNKLEGEASKLYDAAKDASDSVLPQKEFVTKLVPKFDNQIFQSSDAARYVGTDFLSYMTNLTKDGNVDVNKAFSLKSKLQDLMSKVSPSRNPVDRDAYQFLSGVKDNLENSLQNDYKIPMKDLSGTYSKIGDFKAAMGADVGNAPDIQSYKTGKETALDKMSNLFKNASENPASDEALQIENAYNGLRKSNLVAPETLDASLNATKKAASDAKIIESMYGGGMHTGTMGVFKSLGLGAKAVGFTGAAMAGKVSVPVKNAMYNTAQRLNQATPEFLMNAANAVKDSGAANMLKQLATKPAAQRNALIFTMMQQPSYQQMMGSIFNDEDANTGGFQESPNPQSSQTNTNKPGQ